MKEYTQKVMSRALMAAAVSVLGAGLAFAPGAAQAKEKVHALYIPLADHYAGIVAYELYRDQMKEADYTIEKMRSWPSLRGKFMAGRADLAYVISPMAMNMFAERSSIRWVSLIHRDGNALAINSEMENFVSLAPKRIDRKPNEAVAQAFSKARDRLGRPSVVAVPSLESTHTVILYKFLKKYGLSLALGTGDADVVARAVAPPKSPSFLKSQSKKGNPASFEQSLPWADVVETGDFGKVAWYSKDVLVWPNGHVECIVIAQGAAVDKKNAAIKEVIHYIHKAGRDIENAMAAGGDELKKIAVLIRKHIPGHTEEAIIQSLSEELRVINYSNLNVDNGGLRQVMDLAVEAGVMKNTIDIDAFADDQFRTDITELSQN